MPIRLLPPEVASQIAAGEVVERPASVVKELIENALDAGARRIAIVVEGAGQRLIEVVDDGCGIPPDELPLAVARHATSKLTSAADLFHIHTLGFRGEALASMASVSRLVIISRPADSQTGTRLQVEAGETIGLGQVGAPTGTLVRVADLFFNLPARKKFLKSDNTERRRIEQVVMHYALAYPAVRFQLQQEGRLSFQTGGNGSRREVLAALYGVEIARQMLEVLAAGDRLNVAGFISPISLSRSNRREIHLFANGRPIQDATLTAAVVQAYHTLLMVGRYPLAVLFLELPTENVDVNVHPTKGEVRFREAERIFSSLRHAVRAALMAHSPVPGLGEGLRWEPPPVEEGQARKTWPSWGIEPHAGQPQEDTGKRTDGVLVSPVQPSQLRVSGVPILRHVGQIASTYLVAEGPDGLYLIDQHAAHERVLFEQYMSLRGNSIPSQVLLQSTTVQMPPNSARLLEEQLPILARLGFHVEVFGPSTFLVRAIPSLLSGMDPAAALWVLVEDFEEDESPLQAAQEGRLIARVCKRAAVKAGQALTVEEQQRLLSDLEACQSPRTCPHGRPTMIHLSVDLLERQFGRRGAR